jgi:hypothetical protein
MVEGVGEDMAVKRVRRVQVESRLVTQVAAEAVCSPDGPARGAGEVR